MRNRISTLLAGALFFVLTTCNYAYAQVTTVKLIDSYDLLKRGIALNDTGQFDKAAALFEQISRNDTNYALAVYEDAVSRISAGEDSLAIG
ncbi:MAG TPA: hypothetical protein VN922_11675, partial [Bacteroidia bacterium]|nr:hypothetical protein [Bacteroidia bacterium]